MTEAQILFWRRAQHRAADLATPLREKLLRVFAMLRDRLDDASIKTLLRKGAVDEIVQTALSDEFLDRALLPLSKQIRTTIEKGFEQHIKDLPRAGRVDGVLAVSFDTLNPDVVTAIETLEQPALLAVKTDARAIVRAAMSWGLEHQQSPAAIARDLRSVIGLGPSQLEEVQNFRRALEGERNITGYTLRDKRLDTLLKKKPLTPSQVERYAAQYLERRVASNAITVTRTLALNSYKQGQDLTWKQAQANGVVPDGYMLWKTWIQIQRPSMRDDHIPLDGERVPFDTPYSNGSMIPGDQGEYNCGCVSLIVVVRK